ncbi:thermonuclease family protein [Pseudooceanicola sp. LIPI14-2-Ac024]|uniref:thermonuclease family protein n=1 Tax=Pseudooceanicola sp. LIPI14-2-Ac024 TaxID=3344875 RepID=UPI0035D054EB
MLLAFALLGIGLAMARGVDLPAADFLMKPAPAPRALMIDGPVTHVRDGDTIEVRGTPVRIANLDCAERGTADGAEATFRMIEIAQKGPMLCRLEGRKSWDREVGVCALPDGRDIGEILISEGTCDRWQG